MINNKKLWLSTILVLGTTQSIAAKNDNTQNKAELEKYGAAIQQLSNQKISVKSVSDSPFKDIKEVVITTGSQQQIVYLSEDGQFLFEGNLMDIKNKQNLTELTRSSLRQELMSEFKKNHTSIDFLPEQMTDQITVFTDIDCGVCRKFHENVSAFNDAGIGVSYLFFPRAGIGSASHQKAVNVWCADDQQQAISLAKSGVELKPLMCPNPIETQYKLALSAGVNGTPYIVLDDGTLIRGYQTPNQLKQRLEQNKNKQ